MTQKTHKDRHGKSAKRLARAISLIFLSILISCEHKGPQTTQRADGGGPSAARQSPQAVASSFFSALRRNKTDEAGRLIAVFPKVPGDFMKRRIEVMASRMSAGRWDSQVISGRAVGGAAVVIINEGLKSGQQAFDIDPVYLIRQKESWRILPKLTRYNRPYFEFSERQIAEFQQLEKWYKEQKAGLIEQRRGVGKRSE